MNYVQVGVELIIGFIALFTTIKLLGKTQINHLTPFDFISSLVLGEFVGAAIYDDKIHIGMVLFTIVLWGLLVYIVEKVTQKFRSTRGILEGNPSIVIRDGKIDRTVLHSNKMDINQLLALLRQKDVFSVREIKYAIMESNGAISVMKNSGLDAVTRDDMDISTDPTSLTYTIISDGKIDESNLREAGLEVDWLKKQLQEQGLFKMDQIVYGEWNKQDGLYIQEDMKAKGS